MFSTMPSTGTVTRSNIFTPRSASPTATSCGVVTMIAPVHLRRLHERELRVAGSRRHVDDEVVELAPRDVAQELRDDLHHDRPAPDRRLVALDQEAEADDLDAVRLERNDLFVDHRSAAR